MSSFGRIRHAVLPDGQIGMMDFAGWALPLGEKQLEIARAAKLDLRADSTGLTKPALIAKIFIFTKIRNYAYFAHPCRSRGAFRDRHERWVRDAMDALAQLTNAANAVGKSVWS